MSHTPSGSLPRHAEAGKAEGKDAEVSSAEVHAAVSDVDESKETLRALKSRQMSMIAIGGAIGTGLIIGSGNALARAGPASLFLAYCIMGAACFGVMCALGEMSTKYPSKKGFSGHASRCVDPAFGFATAIIYLCKYLVVSPAQIVAFALVIRFWNTSINGAVWVTILILFVAAVNILGIRWFGEIEFWLSFIKIISLTGLILLAFIIDLGGVPGQERIGFAYWQDGRAFKPYLMAGSVGQFLGVIYAMVQALFAFMGCEIVGITVGEAQNPRKTVPAAIRKTFFRIAFFYIIGVLSISMAVNSDSPLLAQANRLGSAGGAAASPFVVAVQAAGVKVVPAVANAAILVFTISAANSDQYIASRTLYGLAKDGSAPRIFTKCSKRGVPVYALCFTGPFMFLAYLVSSAEALTVFNYFSSAITIFGGLAWICILSSHIAFMRGMKKQCIPRATLPWVAPLQPYLSYFSLSVTVVICFFKGFDAFMPFNYRSFITHYIGVPVFVISYVGYKFWRKIPFQPLSAIDFEAGAREFYDVDIGAAESDKKQGMPLMRRIVYGLKNW